MQTSGASAWDVRKLESGTESILPGDPCGAVGWGSMPLPSADHPFPRQGKAHVALWEWRPRPALERVPSGELYRELGRLRSAMSASRRTLSNALSAGGGLATGCIRSALADLDDPLFLHDVEQLVLQEHLEVASALAKLAGDQAQLLGEERSRRTEELARRLVRCLEGYLVTGRGVVAVGRRADLEDLLARPAAVVVLQVDPELEAVARELDVPLLRTAAPTPTLQGEA